MNRLVWLPAVVLLSVLGMGCQSTKFPSPKWPDIALFKKKDKELAPPSQHFDVAEQQQLADSSTAERKPTQIPGESTAGAIKTPSDLAKPTAPMVAAKSGSAPDTKSSPASSSMAATAPAPENAAAAQPIRKPYEIARSGAESLNQAANTIASDIQQGATAAKDQLNRNANEVVGQFQQQGRGLANAAGNSLNQAAANLNQSASNALNLGATNPVPPAGSSASPASSGGAFAFNRAPATPASAGSPPPWSSPSAAANSNPPATSNSPLAPSNPSVDPLKALAASSALVPSNPPSSSSSAAPSPFASKSTPATDRQLQPINQQLVNQNLGAPAAQDSSSGQFQLPVAQPPTFVANRSSASGSSSYASTSPAASPATPPAGFNPSANPSTNQGTSPAAVAGRQTTAAGSPSNYPSTGFNAFVAAGSGNSKPLPAATESKAANAAFQPAAGAINAAWQTQANSSAPNSPSPAAQPVQASENRPVSYTAELPAELMQRSGSYAPGSVGADSGSQTLWR